jgi:arginyl-tRNA synthetase
VYQKLMERLQEALSGHVRESYGVELAIVLERPPKIEMGEAASPICFELAKRLKRGPRQIAQEIANGLKKVEGIERVEVAGGGYLNAYFDHSVFWTALVDEVVTETTHRFKAQLGPSASGRNFTGKPDDRLEKIIVEHTSINPNKAAHIGHVRNAVLGDTIARNLCYAGHNVQVQNYIDNTGVQVADVVIGFLHMEKRTPIGVKMMAMEPKFDYYCWDLYAKVTNFFAEDKARATKLRGETLRAIEQGKGEDAEVAQVVADAVVACHLRTMARLGITYELLARESEILQLKFWDTAFEMMKKSGAIQLATGGKMAGCWVLPWKEEEKAGNDSPSVSGQGLITENAEDSENTEAAENSQDKIIVRSNGTVTYVGKDIAYQLWKFGLLGKDFHYQKWPNAPEGQAVWSTTSSKGDDHAPHFGEAATTVYNVIDARQAYLQKVVAAGLRALGHGRAADQSVHLSYEIVTLTPRCAAEMGYSTAVQETESPNEPMMGTSTAVIADDANVPAGDKGQALTNLRARAMQVSGRKGHGVKADDLIDRLEMATEANVLTRHPTIPVAERKQIGHAIAIGALRFFLLKFTRGAIIAFDFQDALNFEGETGPYCQYAIVRARSIWRKGAQSSAEMTSNSSIAEAAQILDMSRGDAAQIFLDRPENIDLWELVLAAGSLDYAVEATITAQEPAFMARYAFQLAQAFNNFYHKHHILSETDEQKRAFLLRLTELVEAQLVRALGLLGIEAPEKM